MKVLKFGGTSVGTPERMQSVARIIQSPGRKIVVLSALSGTTNALVSIAEDAMNFSLNSAIAKIEVLENHYEDFLQKLYTHNATVEPASELLSGHFNLMRRLVEQGNFRQKEEKIMLAQGELMSTKLFQMYLEENKIASVLINALDFMRTNEEGEADLEFIENELTLELQKHGQQQLVITQGYICKNTKGEIDNLKRGGSDYTASLIGAAIRSEEVQIWTDIDGMHNNDPRFVTHTFPVSELSFDEAAELAYFGAKILHPSSIWPAQKYNIPVRLLNTMQPDKAGTIIRQTNESSEEVKSIAAKDGITAINIKSSRMLMAYGFLRKIFEVFEKYKTPIDMITTSEVAVSLTIDEKNHLNDIVSVLRFFGTVEIDENLTIICIVGGKVGDQTSTAAKIFGALKDIHVRMISYGGSKNNISILVNTEDKVKVLNLLNEGLFADKIPA